ncbi:MAG TPA: NADH-quinone oxidoreductase subunit C, partial [Methylomirabilota bacterium]
MSGERLERTLAEHGGTALAREGDSLRARVRPAEVPALADALAGLGLEPQLVTAADTRRSSGDFTLVYVFAPPTHRPVVTVLASLAPDDPRMPSLATRSFAASRFEREVHDLLGIVPEGHPDPRRLALHQFWPDGYHPLRRDAPAVELRDEGQPFPFRTVDGEGIFEITVGPVHAGIIEPGHFRFSVEGET